MKKRIIMIGAAIISIASFQTFVPNDINAHADSGLSVSAGVSSSCTPILKTFTVPSGKTAIGFDIDEFNQGVGCYTGAIINDGGFQISSGACPAQKDDIYYYRKNPDGSTSKMMPLGNLRIPEGTYCLSFNGGRGGHIKLSYSLTP